MDDPTLNTSSSAPSPVPAEGVGSVLAGYRLIKLLGEGGFGVVYEAQQSRPIERRVAIKLMKSGAGSADFVARFNAERHALARMDHPHISTVLDAGSTADGRPFFVMEKVEGEAITEFCDRHQLTVEQRLSLFVQVCEAIQHAHSKGVIHRDLKPGNVLVGEQDGRPFAKVIDFGIAKAIDLPVEQGGTETAMHVIVGTPSYMSPEQAEGSSDIDTRSDIYALGVLLYQLLTRSTPFDAATLRGASVFEIQRIIREVEPPKPSERLTRSVESSSITAQVFRETAARLRARVKGELDWVVMKAINKDRAQRYQSASEFAADLQRYLSGRPVLAAPPSVIYRSRKFARRHAGWVAAAAVLLLSLIGGVMLFAWQAQVARERANQLAQMIEFEQQAFAKIDTQELGVQLIADLERRFDRALEKSDLPAQLREQQRRQFKQMLGRVNGTDATRRLLDLAVLRPSVAVLDQTLTDQPVLEASLRQMLADRYQGFGLYRQALPLQQRALTLRESNLGAEHPDTLQSQFGLVGLLWDQSKRSEAEDLLRQVIERADRRLGSEAKEVLEMRVALGSLLLEQLKDAEARSLIEENYERLQRLFGADDELTRTSLHDLAILQEARGEVAEAEASMRSLIERETRMLGADHRDVRATMRNLANLLQSQEKFDQAEALLRAALDSAERSQGDSHPETLYIRQGLADLAWARGELDASESAYAALAVSFSDVLGPEHIDSLAILHELGALQVQSGKWLAAEQTLTRAWQERARVLGTDHEHALNSLILLSEVLGERTQFGRVRDLLQANLSAIRQVFAETDPEQLARALTWLGGAVLRLGDANQAEKTLEEARAILDALPERDAQLDSANLRLLIDRYEADARVEAGSARLPALRAQLSALQTD